MYSSLVKVEILVGPPNIKNQLLELPFEKRPLYYKWSETIPETGSLNFALVSLGTEFVQIGQAEATQPQKISVTLLLNVPWGVVVHFLNPDLEIRPP